MLFCVNKFLYFFKNIMEELLDLLSAIERSLLARDTLQCQRLMHEFIKKRESYVSPSMYWMTINFKPDVSIDKIANVMHRLSQRSFMTEYWYSFEQRSESINSIHGIHCHWLICSKHPMGQLKRDVFNTVKTIVGNVHHVDLRKYDISMKQDKLDYLYGKKWDVEKDLKVQTDRLFRLENNLEPIYTNGIQAQARSSDEGASSTTAGEVSDEEN